MTGLRALLVLLLSTLVSFAAAADDFPFHAPVRADDPSAAAAMRDLADRMLPVYQDPDSNRYLANLSALQLVAGNYAAAEDTRQTLRDRLGDAGKTVGRELVFDLYSRARAIEAGSSLAFPRAFSQSYQETVPKLSDLDASALTVLLEAPLPPLQDAVQKSFDRLRGGDSIPVEAAVDLVWTYLSFDAYRNFGPLVPALAEEDDRNRYVAEDGLSVKVGGGTIHVRLIRPKGTPDKRPALFEFAKVPSLEEAKAAVAHGYVGVVAEARGRSDGGEGGLPFENDGEDVRAVIKWIVHQPWSDGRVGLHGESYGGFAAWAAARHLPSAVKAIAVTNPMAPGIDFPAQGGIYRNSAYHRLVSGWSDEAAAQWPALDQKWYRSGRPYRDLDRIAGTRSLTFQHWLDHPSYDRYWQKLIPFREQFAHVGVPVLIVTGYYAGDEAGALYYFSQHRHYHAGAGDTLVVGPYGDAMRGTPPAALRGYPLDSAALVDLRELRLRWFDHVFKGSAAPPLLQDQVNYEVMGANLWRHASSLEAMANATQRFYLDAAESDGRHRLNLSKPSGDVAVAQIVDFSDRSDAVVPDESIVGSGLSVPHALAFASEALQQPLELGGLLSGLLDFKLDKMDVDLSLGLYELSSGGEYLQLSAPCEVRASYATDRTRRHLLKAGERQQLAFACERLAGRRLQAGSRLVLMLGVDKRPDRELNYGTGNDVSTETIADARTPLKIWWYGGSYIDLPVRK
jgi:putative CocE/NonD family hydrolase